jgi:hypothetical protein
VVHHAYSKHAEVTVPSLDDWEKQWKQNPQEMQKPKLVPLDFRRRRTTCESAPRKQAQTGVLQARRADFGLSTVRQIHTLPAS